MSETSLIVRIDGSQASSQARNLDGDLDRLKAGGDRVSGSFDRLSKDLSETGVRMSALDERIRGAVLSQDKLSVSTRGNTEAMAALTAQVRQLADALRKAGDEGNGAAPKVDGLSASLRTLYAGFAAYGGLRMVEQIIETGVAFDSLNQKFTAVFQTAGRGREELQFVRTEAERLGLNVRMAAESYGSFAAASLGTNLEGERTREIFSAVSEAAGRLHLSADQTNGALLAIQQMMSKGTVQAEELRGQLGERLPGAFQIAARAMGVTTRDLGKMLEQGQVATDVFLPKFADELRRTFDTDANLRIDSVASNFARLRNEIEASSASLGEFLNHFLSPAAGAMAEFLQGFRGGAGGGGAIRGAILGTANTGAARTQAGVDAFGIPDYARLGQIDPFATSSPFYGPGAAPRNDPIDLSFGVTPVSEKLLQQYQQRLAYAKATTAEERVQWDIANGKLRTENQLVQQAALAAARAEDQASAAKQSIRADAATSRFEIGLDNSLERAFRSAVERDGNGIGSDFDRLVAANNTRYEQQQDQERRAADAMERQFGARRGRSINYRSNSTRGSINADVGAAYGANDAVLEQQLSEFDQLKNQMEDSTSVLSGIWQKYEDERVRISEQGRDAQRALLRDQVDGMASSLGDAAEIASAFGKSGFEAYKHLAAAQAMISAITQIQDAAAWGMRFGGPLGAGIAATLAGGAALARVAQIESMEYAGARELGGPMFPGQAYLVGEKGPEIVVPPWAGNVVPAQQTAAAMGRSVAPNVQIINNGQAMQVSQQSWDGETLRMVVEQAASVAEQRTASGIASGRGSSYRAIQSTFSTPGKPKRSGA